MLRKILIASLVGLFSEFTSGSRIFGWLSVAFDEIDSTANVTRHYKIEGYFKPVLQNRKP
jgi:hypothetical protein